MATFVDYEVESSWMAGIMDGEGSICISKAYYTKKGLPVFGIDVTISNTREEVLEPFITRYGGKIRYLGGKPKVWTCPAKKEKQFVTDVLPYLRLKGEQAKVILKFKNLPREIQHHDNGDIKEEKQKLQIMMKQLNHPFGR